MESNSVCQAVGLALATSKSVLQIANLLKSRQTGTELKNLYRHLVAHCAIVSGDVERISSAVGPDNELIVRLLELFKGLISYQVTYGTTDDVHSRLHALNERWDSLKNQSADAKLGFVNQYLTLERLSVLQFLDESFDLWERDVLVEYPEDGSQWPIEEHEAPRNKRNEPPYSVGSAAQSLFETLARTTKCECNPTHEIGARLCLGTYRKPDLNGADDTNDFDMFLALHQDWREAHVHTVRASEEQRVVDDQARSLHQKKLNYKPMVVKKLCEPLRKMQETQKMASKRLEFKVERDQLLKLLSESSSFRIDKKEASVSLQQFIQQRPPPWTEKTKRILAVLLGYAVLHLHGTPWLRSKWDTSNIFFFRSPSSRIPLRPFVQVELSDLGVSPHPSRGEQRLEGEFSPSSDGDSYHIGSGGIDSDNVDPDDLDFDDMDHPFPTLVTLAVVLMELYLAKPFSMLARDRKLEFPDSMDSPTRSLDVDSVFREWKHEIPQNLQVYYVIERCLNPRVWEDEEGHLLCDQMLRAKIYQEVVRPLEDELCCAFDFINIDELDTIAGTLDLNNWGQTIRNLQIEGHCEQFSVPQLKAPLLNQNQSISEFRSLFHHSLFVSSIANTLGTPSHLPGSWRQLTSDSAYDVAKFYDDEKPSEQHSPVEIMNYVNWQGRYKAVLYKFIELYRQQPPEHPVKVAVLDSGIDETHNDFATGQVKIKQNWTNNVKAVHDRDGHGTFTASLLVHYAPDAELYIAKIADGKPSPPGIIADAVNTAVDEWKVDIISMSFGYPTNQIDGYEKLENALLYAHYKGVLLFAAASNSGANLDRAYPARDPHVICIHSTDSNGNRSKFSPTALACDPNIATIGEAIESAWPVVFCNTNTNPTCLQIKSGTSYATPIAVGIAVFLLQYARIHLADKADMLKRKAKMEAALLKIAEKTQHSMRRDGYNYVALSLFPDNLFGKDKKFIDATIGELLNG